MNVVKLLWNLAGKIGIKRQTSGDVVELLLDLAEKVARGQISLDDAVAEVHRIKAMLDEKAVTELITLTNNLANQSPPLTYYLATLTYEAVKVIKNRFLQGYSAYTLANLSLQLARYPQTIKLYQEALPVAEELNNNQVIGAILGSLGIAYGSLGQYQKAIDYFEQALKIAREIGDRQGEGSDLSNLGNAYRLLGQYQKAINYSEQALKIAQEIRDRQGESTCLGNLGNAYFSLGQYQKAIEYYEKALKIAQEIGDRNSEGKSLGNLGIAYNSLGQYQKAISYYERALKIAQEIEDRKGEGKWLGNLGNVYRSLGQYEKAIDYYEQALRIALEIGIEERSSFWPRRLDIVFRSVPVPIHKRTAPTFEELDLTQKMAVLKEKEAYLKMEKELMPEYSGKFVAVLQGEVIGVGEDESELALRIYKKYGYVPMYIGQVGVRERVIRIPSPKIRKR